MDTNRIAKAFIRLRDTRAALKKEFETADTLLKSKQARLEAEMLRILTEGRMESVATESGTFYRQEELTASAADWAVLYEWIRENDAFDALERRVKKSFVKEFMETHEGALPPGISVFREYVVRVRRS